PRQASAHSRSHGQRLDGPSNSARGGAAASGATTALPSSDASALLEHAQTGLFVVQDEHFAYVNATFVALVGWNAAELVGQHHEITTAPEFRVHTRAVVERRLAGKPGRAGQVRCLRRDGSQFDARVFARLISFAGRPAVLVTLFDIAELTAALREVQW